MRNGHHDKLIPELAGAIFMCRNETRQECFHRRIFGLPASREPFVRKVRHGMFLFLFDTDDRKMFGVFKATSNGKMNIVPEAYSLSGSTFPAQVQFAIIRTCKPLTESEFKPAIKDNYFTDIKFNLDLNCDQVQRLLLLFEEKEVREVPRSITDRLEEKKVREVPRSITDRRSTSSSDLPLERSYVYNQQDRSNTNTLRPTIDRPSRYTDSNAHAAVVFRNSDMNSRTPRNIYPGQQIDMNVVENQTEICHSATANLCHHTNDPALQAVKYLSSLNLAQQNATFRYCTGTSNCVVCALKMFPEVAYNSRILRQAPCELHVNLDDQQVTLSAYNNPNISAPGGDPDCFYPEYVKKRVGTHSDIDDGLQLRDRVYNNGLQGPRKSVFLRLAGPPREEFETEPCETSAYAARRKEVSKFSIEFEGNSKKRKIVRNYLMNTCTEAETDPDFVDQIEVHPTAPVSTSAVGPGETEVPFVNFKRRNGGSKLGIEPKEEKKKKRRLIRPSLELDDKTSHMEVLEEGPMKVAMYLNKPSNSLVALDGASMVQTHTADVEAQVGNENLELLQGSVCKSSETQAEVKLVDTPDEGVQGSNEGERVLVSGIGIETERSNLDLDTSNKTGSLVTALGQYGKDESNEISVSVENDNKQKPEFEESKKILFTSHVNRVKLPEKSKVQTGHEAETKSDDPQMILNSVCEKSDASKLDEASETFSGDLTELLVLCENTDKMKPVSNTKPMDSKPVTEVKDNIMLDGRPDNSKISLCLHSKESINLNHIATNLETCLVSHMRNSYPVEEPGHFAPDKMEMAVFSFCQNNIPAEDYIALE